MADTYIPGVKSRYDTERLIEDLMKLERVPKERAEKKIETLNEERAVWQEVGRRMSALRESSKTLYSFQNPFNERVARSSDENVLTATATREATEQERTFVVRRIATNDRFLSAPLAEDYKVPAGDYRFAVGTEEVSFAYKGGSLKEFIESLNRRSRNLIAASVITVEPGTRTLVIESKKTGSANRLVFSGAAESLAVETGMMQRVSGRDRQPSASPEAIQPVSAALDRTRLEVHEEGLLVRARGEARIPIQEPVEVSGELRLDLNLKSLRLADSSGAVPTPPAGPVLPVSGDATYGGVTVTNDPSFVPLPPWSPPPVPPRVDTLSVLRLGFTDGTSVELPPVHDSISFDAYSYRLADYAQGRMLSSIDLVNANTHRDIAISSIRISDPSVAGNLKPLHTISTADDAVVVMDGIEVKRPSNEIDNLIPGVTLSLREASEDKVRLSVEPDTEAAKNAIIELVGNYNRLLAEINVLTRTDEKVLNELTYLETDERDGMRKRLGLMQGDSSLNQYRAALQRLSSAAYPTSLNRDMALLSQIGVSTDASRSGATGGYDASRLRGYLEIDEKKLDKALESQIEAIRELFGNDTDADRIIDSGFAYAIDVLTRAWVETGGFLQMKTGTIDNQITQQRRQIETLDKQLAAKELELRRKYGAMESALNSMERTSTSLDQFSRQGRE